MCVLVSGSEATYHVAAARLHRTAQFFVTRFHSTIFTENDLDFLDDDPCTPRSATPCLVTAANTTFRDPQRIRAGAYTGLR